MRASLGGVSFVLNGVWDAPTQSGLYSPAGETSGA
jgi:hypothetical protein